MFHYKYDIITLLYRAVRFGSILLLLVLVGMGTYYVFKGLQSSQDGSLDSNTDRVIEEMIRQRVR